MVWKKIGAGAGAVAVVAGSFGLGALYSPAEVEVENPVNVELAHQLGVSQAELAAMQEAIAELEVAASTPVVVEVPVETIVEREVLVDNGNLELVLQELWDAGGDISYLTAGLEESEISMIVDRIEWRTEAIALAEAEVRAEGRFLVASQAGWDVRDIGTTRIVDSSLDVHDYEDGAATITVEAEFRYDGAWELRTFEVELFDGEVEDLQLL